MTSNWDGSSYQSRFDALAAEGMDVHGEAALVRRYQPRTVLDAGCGTGRVAVELARHGISTTGVDLDGSMIAEARRRAPDLTWVEASMAGLDLGRCFDVVVMAGNVPIFCPPDDRDRLVRSAAAHVDAGGVLIAGFQLDRGYHLEEWDRAATAGGLRLEARWSTWAAEPWEPGGPYAVSVHRRG